MRGLLPAMLIAAAPLGAAAAGDGDAAAGAQVFKRCASCHAVGPEAVNKTGPVLNGVVGQKAGQVPGFEFSQAMLASDLTLDPATLAQFLRSPRKVVPGTKMTFPGLPRPADVANVIAYLQTFDSDGQPAQATASE